MKKYLITITGIAFALIFTMQANAASAPYSSTTTNTKSAVHKTHQTENNAFDGIYVGAGIGSTNIVYKFRYNDGNDDFPDGFNFGKNIVDIVMLAGYGMTFSNKFYFGGELFGNYTNRNRTFTDMSVDNKYRYGIAARLGYLVSSAIMVYGTLGSNYSKFSFYWDEEKSCNSKKRVGIIPGIGVETALTHNVLLRMQYTHTIYNTIKVNVGDDFKIKPNRSTFTLGISYLFA